MKKLLKLALMAGLLSGAACAENQETPSGAVSRFEGVQKVFEARGVDAIAFLNGVGTLASGTGKGRENENLGLESGIDNVNDPESPLICIGADDTYIVNSEQTSLVGKSAVSGENIWRDGTGNLLVKGAREALSRGTPSGLTSIKYVQNTTMVNPREGQVLAENFDLAIADGRHIKGLPEGSFCAIRFESQRDRDTSDLNRKENPDGGAYPREKTGVDGADVPHHKHHKHHKHHGKHHEKVTADKAAKEAKKEEVKAETAAKTAEAAKTTTKVEVTTTPATAAPVAAK